jgi:hypothetical protein
MDGEIMGDTSVEVQPQDHRERLACAQVHVCEGGDEKGRGLGRGS